MIFLSTYENKIDRKGRVSVPATFRATLEVNSQPLIITKSLTASCLEGQGSARIQQIVDVLDTMDALAEETRMLQTLLSNAQEMKLDAEGRRKQQIEERKQREAQEKARAEGDLQRLEEALAQAQEQHESGGE